MNASKLALIVCADDFGISPEVNKAVLALLAHQRISAVSCLVRGSAWMHGAVLLKEFQGRIDIGLHLSYKDIPFHHILALAYARQLGQQEVLEVFKSQLDDFMESMGRPPDYIDGHQHLHQFPVFRQALMALLRAARLDKIYVRNSAVDLDDILRRRVSILKNMLIAGPAFNLKKDLQEAKIYTNEDFLGIYDFNTSLPVSEMFERLLRSVSRPNSVFVSHPSDGEAGRRTGFYQKRVEELKYLESGQYQETLEICGLYPARFTPSILDDRLFSSIK